MSTPSVVKQPSYAELLAKIQDLTAQVEASKVPKGIEFKVAEKGGVSAVGFGRFPVTLYYEQWIKLIEAIAAQDLRFILDTFLSQGLILMKETVKGEPVNDRRARSMAHGRAQLAARAAQAAAALSTSTSGASAVATKA